MIAFKLIFEISKTHLFSRLKQSVIAALGVTFGIGTFIIMVSFMTGLNGLLDGLILDRTPHIHIYNEIKPSEIQPIQKATTFKNNFNVVQSIKPKQSQTKVHNALPLIHELEKDKRVLGVTPQVNAKVFFLGGAIEVGGVSTGINAIEEARLFNFDAYIIKGSAKDLVKNNQGVLLGSGIAKKLKVDVGNRIQMRTATGALFYLKIVGIYQSGLAEIDNMQSYVNIETAQQFNGVGKSYITDINVKLHDMEKSVGMAKIIRDNYGLSAVDIKSANAQFETGTSIRNLITYAVSIALLIVAGFGIYNILNMLIYEKMNDIAILKATGFSGKDVQRIFISQAMIIGFVGGCLGLIIGYLVSVLISRAPFETDALPTIDTYPVNFDVQFYVTGFVFAIVSTFLAGYLPSRRAKKIDPVDIIRGQ